MKKYNQSPLPFQGQKRRFLRDFREALKDFPSDAVYVDLFGGSGLLSHTVKSVYPNARVIWNDFDNYTERLANVSKTNEILADFRKILKDYPQELRKKGRIIGSHREQILERLRQETGFVDWISISSSIGFSMNYKNSLQEFEAYSLYYRVRQTDFCADGYLQGVERVRMDYKELFEQFKNVENVVFLLDPPYLSTDCTTYSSKNYWKLTDYLNILQCLKGTKYFYFTSNKSQIVELAQWLSENGLKENPFNEAKIIELNANMNYQTHYKDIMIYKHRGDEPFN